MPKAAKMFQNTWSMLGGNLLSLPYAAMGVKLGRPAGAKDTHANSIWQLSLCVRSQKAATIEKHWFNNHFAPIWLSHQATCLCSTTENTSTTCIEIWNVSSTDFRGRPQSRYCRLIGGAKHPFFSVSPERTGQPLFGASAESFSIQYCSAMEPLIPVSSTLRRISRAMVIHSKR